jgi:hypothetical protein
MPSFTKSGTPKVFGKNEYKFSTQNCAFASYTVAKNTVAYTQVDGINQRILQPGTALAAITSGPDTGKVGPFQASGTADVWTATPSGTWSGGTFTVTVDGATTAPLPFNTNLADLSTAVNALPTVNGQLVLTGGPIATTATVFTSSGAFNGPHTISVSTASVTGTTPAIALVHTTTGVSGATDGRQTSSNLVGLLETFLPWQLLEHDAEVSVLYMGAVVQGWCLEYNAAGQPIALQNATATAMVGQKSMDIIFK